MKIIKAILALAALSTLAGCSFADQADLGSIGRSHTVTVYSGGQPVRVWHSRGQVSSNAHSDGCFFEDATTHKLVEIQGPCVIEQD